MPMLVFYAGVLALSLLWWGAFRSTFVRRERCLLLALGVVGLWLWLWIWSLSEPSVPFSDFNVAYYPAGRAIIEDLPRLFRRCWDTPVCGFVNIPIVALLFTPFSMLTLRHAQWLFVALSLVGLVVTLLLLWSMTDREPSKRWAILLLFAMNGPLVYSLKEGNLTHCALLVLVAGVVCLDRGWERSAGGCFALAAIIKLPLLLFAVYFVGMKKWRAAFGYGLTLATISGLSLWYAGWASHVAWYREVILPLSDKGLSAFNVQSIEGVLLRLQDDARLYDWTPVAVSPDIRMAGRLCAALLFGLSCLLCLRRPGTRHRDTMYVELSMVLCLALLISPISWTHYYLFLLLPLSLYAGNRLPMPDRGGWLAAMTVATLLLAPPVTFTEGAVSRGLVEKLLLSHYVLGALLLWGVLAYARWRMVEVQQFRLVVTKHESARDRRAYSVPVSHVPDESPDRKIAG
ncbi:conserved membrane hypothetical protein [Nitrospira defluvii]|uniref:DUF2029 domain-containing protein n=2 Tax=Nitrospira defluvii TaxID=330214 RepID=A0ABM8QF85_9BACT|nr:conserved membrane hypothetical protein [Nitrospira defluvii]